MTDIIKAIEDIIKNLKEDQKKNIMENLLKKYMSNEGKSLAEKRFGVNLGPVAKTRSGTCPTCKKPL